LATDAALKLACADYRSWSDEERWEIINGEAYAMTPATLYEGIVDAIDRKILNLIQTAFPLDAEPYRWIGEQTGVTQDEAFNRVRKLRESSIIRRIGAVFDPKKLGFVSTLCAARVPEEKLKGFVKLVNACPGVTHNYRRNHDYNVWFTVIAAGEDELNRLLGEIREKTGIADILNLRAVRTFKINARFDF
jgi:DNA-binding Lrp family transcriptional regulator